MNRWILIAGAGLCACSGTRPAPSAETTSPFNNVSYAFSATTPDQIIQGMVLVNTSGTFVELDTPCEGKATRSMPTGMPSSTSAIRYYCGGAWLIFDRRNPSTGAKWFANVESPQRREVCDRYETQNGRQVCVSHHTEKYSVFKTLTGGIQVRRIQQG